MANTPQPRRYESADTVPMMKEEIAAALAGLHELRCPACAPTWDKPACACCNSTRFVSRGTFAAWHQREQGRVSETRLDSYDNGEG
jgi:hypothetical protein